MAIRPIVTAKVEDSIKPQSTGEGNAIRVKTFEIRADADEAVLQEVIVDMIDTMRAHPICIGLSANQIGLPISVSIVCLSRDTSKDLFVLVNPEILEASGKKDKKFESCMSVPGYRGQVENREHLRIRYLSKILEPNEISTSGFLARAMRHEIDHCEGLLYCQRIVLGQNLEKTDIFNYVQPEGIPFDSESLNIILGSLTDQQEFGDGMS